MTEAAVPTPPAPPATIGRAVRNQRRAVMLAAGLIVASIWISIPLGEWRIGLFLAAGFVLGLLNHVLTEYALQKAISSGDPMTRQAYASSSLFRLALISVLALAVAAIYWPDGAAVIFGLAIFHMIALTLTAIPLLREVRKS
ncbi:MAG: ATP synthase subunit I [Aeromicrobium sp.]